MQSLLEVPNDEIAMAALAGLYNKRGAFHMVISLLEPRDPVPGTKFGDVSLPLLLRAYEKTNDMANTVKLKRKLYGQDDLA